MSSEHRSTRLTFHAKKSYSTLTQNKQNSLCLNNIITTYIQILTNILNYTADQDHIPSVFDRPQQSDTDDSDGTSESFPEDLESFIIRCINYWKIEKNQLILSLMALDKIIKQEKVFVLTEANVHRTVFVCLMETQKFYEDEVYTNKDYSKICGVSAEELWQMELGFMSYINYDMFIKEDEFDAYMNKFTDFSERIHSCS